MPTTMPTEKMTRRIVAGMVWGQVCGWFKRAVGGIRISAVVATIARTSAKAGLRLGLEPDMEPATSAPGAQLPPTAAAITIPSIAVTVLATRLSYTPKIAARMTA